MSHLSRILEKYPTCYYCEDMDTICVDVNEDPQTIEEDATQIIEEHFEGETIQTPTDTFTVTGKEYVNHVGGVSEAFKLVGIEAW